jgi:hypothetical protein
MRILATEAKGVDQRLGVVERIRSGGRGRDACAHELSKPPLLSKNFREQFQNCLDPSEGQVTGREIKELV